ncbi:hypothetical protein SERLADRAFT_443031 [Serpula lacrymans var. lacrymans S7.9]|uniref:DUF6532 domain-containing protein n=1 Tax=Serpula lacrymans var. lacrymans (strain S7.9) TaxID=578457 RepID=F8PBC6_SERL9|nr:uncharacterized protein SERLADRAFT_443031 [Serpula lacrymans var. lacrymans S7.9]EGO19566.1 hypothetical protein SERLADRAFT_443031 [Serpula lacrymans var. lacrymans S7.9]
MKTKKAEKTTWQINRQMDVENLDVTPLHDVDDHEDIMFDNRMVVSKHSACVKTKLPVMQQDVLSPLLNIGTPSRNQGLHMKANVRASLNLALMPDIMKILTKRTSHVHGERHTKVRGLTILWVLCKLISKDHHTELAPGIDLKENILFVYKDLMGKKGLYKARNIQTLIDDMWFANRNDKGALYHEYFNPISLEIVALILTNQRLIFAY